MVDVENREKLIFPTETTKKVIKKYGSKTGFFKIKTDSGWYSGIDDSDQKITFFEFLNSFGAIFHTIFVS